MLALVLPLLLAIVAVAFGAWGIFGATIAIVDATHSYEIDRRAIRIALAVLWVAMAMFAGGSIVLSRALFA